MELITSLLKRSNLNALTAFFLLCLIVALAWIVIYGFTYLFVVPYALIKKHADDERAKREMIDARIDRELENQHDFRVYASHHPEQDRLHPEPQVGCTPQERISHEDYIIYLQSDEWKSRARRRLEIDEYTCQYCGSELQSMSGITHIPNIHHLHYRTLRNENVYTDLVSLCKHCHLDLHSHFRLHEMEQEINIVRMRNQK